MKYLKTYEGFDDDSIVKCNWCNWVGFQSDLEEEEDKHGDYIDICPQCKSGNHLMDVYLEEEDGFGEDFRDYMAEHDPEPGIEMEDYTNILDWFKDAYPLYFSTKKYNL